ncbi:hypothetical protein GK047_03615 [Paenibacillus sp. SYP-B3998]|uniref:Uncharacterized protein n=1 Tax=Paenibacillus sp. SYP-B3998 TaxID=2678564 RepID=A0A6G3ZUL4_9BACL|nr:hypothetical protein [Paenibacillus sp. SYP-B3998]NEW05107.1 hypothetical protein [Paenibacillus sp. SYP-B3998]
MSKGRVWNKGKRNGGGGPPAGTGYKEKLEAAQKASGIEIIDPTNPINQVKRMNRDNWVERPVRPNQSRPKE